MQSSFTIRLADEYGNVKNPLDSPPVPFQCVVVKRVPELGSVLRVLGTVSPQADGYVCSYEVLIAGLHDISVGTNLDGLQPRHIVDSPMVLAVNASDADANFYRVHGTALNITEHPTGVPIEFEILAMDRFGNPASDVCGPAGCMPAATPSVLYTTKTSLELLGERQQLANVTAVRSGVYAASFVPELAGPTRVDVTASKKPLPDMPMFLVILPNVVRPGNSVVFGEGTQGGFSGANATFLVQLRDTDGNTVAKADQTSYLVAAVFRSDEHCHNVTNATLIPKADVEDLTCESRGAGAGRNRIPVPARCKDSWQQSTPACTIPVDCEGVWGEWTACTSATGEVCGDGTYDRVFVVTRPAQHAGYACEGEHDEVMTGPCSLGPCEQPEPEPETNETESNVTNETNGTNGTNITAVVDHRQKWCQHCWEVTTQVPVSHSSTGSLAEYSYSYSINSTGECSRRRDCHFADTPFFIPTETPAKGRGGCSRMTVSPTARRVGPRRCAARRRVRRAVLLQQHRAGAAGGGGHRGARQQHDRRHPHRVGERVVLLHAQGPHQPRHQHDPRRRRLRGQHPPPGAGGGWAHAAVELDSRTVAPGLDCAAVERLGQRLLGRRKRHGLAGEVSRPTTAALPYGESLLQL